MKAFQIKKHEHPKKIAASTDVEAPKPAEGEVIVDVYSAGLNFFDILQAQNKYQNQPPLPFILGAEFAGVISAASPIPKGCPYKPGDRVFGTAQGSYAEQVCVAHANVLPVPEGMSFDQASGLIITWPTSWEGIVGRGQAKAGDWVLVHAGAGGVGFPAIQIAKSLGCKVIATASSADKLKICTELGKADFGVDYTKEGWQKEVLKITGGRGVDVVFDPVGLLVPSLKVAAWKCRLVVVGFAAGTIEKVPANLVLVKNVSIVGLHLGAYYKKEPSHIPVIWGGLLKGFHDKSLTPIVFDKTYEGLETVGEGLGDLEARKTWGKAVIRVRDESGNVLTGSTLERAKL